MARFQVVPETLPLVRARCTVSRLNSGRWTLRGVKMVPPIFEAYLHLRITGSPSGALRHLVMTVLRRKSSGSGSLESKRFRAPLDCMYLLSFLTVR